MGRFTQAHH